MSIFDILDELVPLLPVIGGMAGHPEVGTLAARLIQLGEEEVQRRMSATGKSRSETLAAASTTYAQFRAENAALKKLGHEND